MIALIVPLTFWLNGAQHEEARRNAYLPELEAQLQQSPGDAQLMALLGGRYIEAGEYSKAADVLKKSVGFGLRDASVFQAWSASYAVSGDVKNAVAVLRFGLESGQCQPSQACQGALNRLGAVPPSSRPQELARAISPGGAKTVTDHYSAPTVLSAFSDIQGHWHPERSGFATRAADASAHPDDLAAQLRWCDALWRNRRLREAESVAKLLTVRFPKSPDAHIMLGNILFAGGVRAKAGLQYKAALAERPNDIDAAKGLGAVGVELNLYRLAIDNYEKAARLAPDDPDTWVGLGRAYLNEQFQFAKSVAAFEKAARLAPKRTDFFPYYSDALSAVYRTDDAEQLLARRLQAEPSDARSHYLIARLLRKNKVSPERDALAEQHLRKSLQLEPNAPAVRVALAQALLDKGGSEAASDAGILLSEANEQDSLDPLTMRLLSLAYRRIGRLDRAKEAEALSQRLADYKTKVTNLEDRERSNPRDIAVHESLAALYAQGGETQKAANQKEMSFMLRHYPEAAQAGITALTRAVTKTGQVDSDTR